MPLGESMITVLRNNKLLTINRDNKFEYDTGVNKTKLDFSKLPKSTPETIKRIQEKITNENKLRQQKQLKLVVCSVILISTLVYVMS